MRKLLVLLSVLFLSILPFHAVYAISIGSDWGGPNGCLDVNGIPTLQCVPFIFHNLIAGALFFAGIVALIMIIVSGIRLILSGGDQKNVEAAKKSLTYAIIGLIVILLSFFIVNVFAYITGAHCLTSFGFDTCSS